MSAEVEGTLIGHYTLVTEKDGQDFVYQARLFQHDITKDFKLYRRWNYINKINKTSWRKSQKWNLKDLHRFNHKLIQKVAISGYDVSVVEQP